MIYCNIGSWSVNLRTLPAFHKYGSTEFRRKSWMWFNHAVVAQEQADADARIVAFYDKFGSVDAAFGRRAK